MSELNGDKARFQRLRKKGVRRRQRTREAWAAIRGGAVGIHHGSDSEQPGGVPGPLGNLHLMPQGSVTE